MKLALADFSSIFKNFLNIGIFQIAGMLLQLLSIPVIIRKYGLEVFGQIALVTSIAYLLGNIVNYGTNQIYVKDISVNRTNLKVLSTVFSEVFMLRLFVFLTITTITIIIVVETKLIAIPLMLSILPIILSEVVNPLYFLIGTEKIQWISWGALFARLTSFLLILYVFVQNNQANILNLFLGLPLLIFYSFLFLYLIIKYNLKLSLQSKRRLKNQLMNNFYVTFNGSIGMLQQSIFLFFVAGSFNSTILGAYGLVDKLLNTIRQIVSAFSSAIYPKAAILFHEGVSQWIRFRRTIQLINLIGSIILGLILYFNASLIVRLITNESSENAVMFVKLLSFAPIFLALNANNILDLLLTEKFKLMFHISIVILISTLFISYILSMRSINISIGWYPLLIEATCFTIYSLGIKKNNLHAP
jgi:O-antigen/teichoic acid export membrane protein